MTPEEHATLVRMETEFRNVQEQMEKLVEKVERIEAQANRWKGAFAAILGLGALAGWSLDKVLGRLGGLP